MLRLVILSIIESFLLCAGQVMLKFAVQHMDKSERGWHFFWHSVVLNWQLACCGALLTAAGLLWMYILRNFNFSHAYPLTALSFVFGILASIWVFREPVTYWQWLGVAVILLGCFLITR